MRASRRGARDGRVRGDAHQIRAEQFGGRRSDLASTRDRAAFEQQHADPSLMTSLSPCGCRRTRARATSSTSHGTWPNDGGVSLQPQRSARELGPRRLGSRSVAIARIGPTDRRHQLGGPARRAARVVRIRANRIPSERSRGPRDEPGIAGPLSFARRVVLTSLGVPRRQHVAITNHCMTVFDTRRDACESRRMVHLEASVCVPPSRVRHGTRPCSTGPSTDWTGPGIGAARRTKQGQEATREASSTRERATRGG